MATVSELDSCGVPPRQLQSTLLALPANPVLLSTLPSAKH